MTDDAPIPQPLADALADRYRLERPLGAGGMATVFLAHDLRHDRKVAVKVLRPELTAILGGERFLAEIKLTANLQHPHILGLFDSGEAAGMFFYVMPFVDGETLRAKLTREKQLAVDEAIRITREVADALDYAHKQGIVHRDIKPENILLHGGHALVADFGIALAASRTDGGTRMTETGMSLGTPHYMSPEQAMGEREITGRADIYALGCVLYEMLTAEPPFSGMTVQSIMARVMTEDPRGLVAQRKSIPLHVEAAVLRALEKLPADRFATAGAFSEALVTTEFATQPMPAAARGTGPRAAVAAPRRASGLVTLGLVALSSLAIGAAAFAWFRPSASVPTLRVDLAVGESTPSTIGDVAISPDGKMIAFVGITPGQILGAIYLRRLDGDANFTRLPGSDGAATPAFSPDGQWIVFRQGANRNLVKMSVTGGGTTILVPTGPYDPYFPHWALDDQLVFGGPSGIYHVSLSAGTPPRKLPTGNGAMPFLLPDGAGVLTEMEGRIVLVDLATDSVTTLIGAGSHPTYVAPGYLLYVAESNGLFAQRFDLAKRQLVGAPLRVLDQVASTSLTRGYTVSDAGTLIHHEGESVMAMLAPTKLVIVDPAGGRADTLPLPTSRRLRPRFSPDGRRVAFEEVIESRGAASGISVFDLVTGSLTSLPTTDDNDHPRWSPDGKWMLYNRGTSASNNEDLFVARADGSGGERQLLVREGNEVPTQWLDSVTILFHGPVKNQGTDLFSLRITDSAPPRPYLAAPWNESDLEVSPDGRWGVFAADEGGQTGIWLREFPDPNGKWRVSPGLGAHPRWSRDGRFVYYAVESGTVDSILRVRIDRGAGGTPVVRAPEKVLTAPLVIVHSWDMHPDGKRFLVALPDADVRSEGRNRYILALHWFEELRRKFAGTP